MGFIKNYDTLASTPQRKIVLDLIETAFAAIQPQAVMQQHFSLQGNTLQIMDKRFDLTRYQRIFVIGFGKGSSGICKIIESTLGEKLTDGYDIDVVDENFSKIHYTKGTHPLPSEENIAYTQTVLEKMQNLTEHDLVLVVICGGGSVLFEAPHTLSLAQLSDVNKALLQSGATISEMNVVRKHLSRVKGGGLIKLLAPATITSLIFSDVPGNDLSVIASGPTTKDDTTLQQVQEIMEKYQIASKIQLQPSDFEETPKDAGLFSQVHNMLIVSNQTALQAMQAKAKASGVEAYIASDKFQGDARTAGKSLLDQAENGKIMLVGGETTIKITGTGKGGRNQALVLSSLPYITDNTIIATFDSDGWDFYGLSGALADSQTIKTVADKGIDAKKYLTDDNSYAFWEAVGDGIDTGKLESNVSDLFIIWKSIQGGQIT